MFETRISTIISVKVIKDVISIPYIVPGNLRVKRYENIITLAQQPAPTLSLKVLKSSEDQSCFPVFKAASLPFVPG